MKTKILSAVVISFLVTFAQADDVEKLFDTKCAICHIKTKPEDMSKVIAPTIMGVMKHIKMEFPQKDKAVEFMVDYLLNPTKEKAICLPEKIAKFGLMPSQKGLTSKEDLIKISNWVFDNYPPKDFRGFGNHKGQGMMRGKGMMGEGKHKNKP